MRRTRLSCTDRTGLAAHRAVGAAVVLLMAALPACTATRHAAGGVTAPTVPAELRVGIAPNYPPLAFKRRGEISGVEADFAERLGPALDAKVTLVETPFEELIPALLANRIDIIMSGMSMTDQRQKLISFAHPYLRVGQMLLLRRVDAKRFSKNAAVNQPKTRLGVVSGTTGEAYARAHFAKAKIKGFDGVDAAVAALRNQEIDVFIHDAPSIWNITAAGGRKSPLVGRYEPLTKEYLAWAVRKHDPLRERLNTVLRQWNGSGELDAVLNRWIHTRRQRPTPTHH